MRKRLEIQNVPRSQRSFSVIKISKFILYKEMGAVCSESHAKQINAFCRQSVLFLGAFPKLRKAIISFVMSVRPSARNNSAPTGWVFMKLEF
jgi:hypothetical protein